MPAISRLRAHEGLAFLSYGFRPFFLLAALQAGLTILVWIGFVTGRIAVPTAFAPVDWHVHEMLFGFQAAAIGGFLLTAIPNWTGRLPVRGAPLLGLVLAWIAGRLAVAFSARIGWDLALALDMAFLILLAAACVREIVAGRNWRNLGVVVLLGLIGAANLAFHLEAHFTGEAAYARRGAIAAILVLVSLIGGRIIPSFTRNWLAPSGLGRLPVPFGAFDKAVLGATVLTCLVWVAAPASAVSGGLLALCAGLHLARLMRWAGDRTWRNPLLVILHVSYLFVPLGFGLGAAASLGWVLPGAGLHAWTAGAFGTLTLAVMSRASLGHTGRPLKAGALTQACYVLVVLGSLARVASALNLGPPALLDVAGLAWSLGFLVFAAAYWPVLTGPRAAQKVPSGPAGCSVPAAR
ncbi:NnrS family protein [Aquabacter sp. L1I39]|uniref:NnrS family protein n=1 Tax=Aquabacter sp. L1I39 TaxID=2820278 RepID=UPI001AD9EC9C|nr:NnrS family protein [Aquabacter sp. L1I39]QTL04404.1 NnrS family protein [Aquabacter sp. L1I39]